MEAINWEAVQAVSEALGLVVVFGSLIFVGLQIRQNAQATKAATMNNIMSSWGDLYLRFSENDSLAALAWNGSQDATSLSGVDRWRLSVSVGGFFHYFHNAYYQWKIGAYEPTAWEAQAHFLTNFLSLPGNREVWDERKDMFPVDFQRYVEKEILTQSPDKDYKMPGH